MDPAESNIDLHITPHSLSCAGRCRPRYRDSFRVFGQATVHHKHLKLIRVRRQDLSQSMTTLLRYVCELGRLYNGDLSQTRRDSMLELAIHMVKDLLPSWLQSIKAHLGLSNRNAVLAIPKSGPCFVGELVEGHTEGSAVLDVRLMLGVVQFGCQVTSVSVCMSAGMDLLWTAGGKISMILMFPLPDCSNWNRIAMMRL